MEWLPGAPHTLSGQALVDWLAEAHGMACTCHDCTQAWRDLIVTPHAREQLARIGARLRTMTEAEFHGHDTGDDR